MKWSICSKLVGTAGDESENISRMPPSFRGRSDNDAFYRALHNWRPDAEIHMIVGGKMREILADKLGNCKSLFYMNTGRMRKKNIFLYFLI